MATQAEMERLLTNLRDATAEAKQAKAELHAERKDYRAEVKAAEERITSAIVAEVERQVGELGETAKQEMRTQIDEVIGALAWDWRAKLGLGA